MRKAIMESDKLLVVCTNSAGDRKLYALVVGGDGKVLDHVKRTFVDFARDDYLNYVFELFYKGCDIYTLTGPKLQTKVVACILVYIQEGRVPDIYDKIYHVYGAEMPKEIPEKIRPIEPMVRDLKSRPRSKVKVDAYSDE